jgi:CheY-like chemotaxis protein
MPSLNGLELCKKLKAMDNSLKAVLLTASLEPRETGDCQAIKVITKPILASKLVEQIKNILNSSQHNT